MRSQYESMVWLRDEKGKTYVCHFDDEQHSSSERYEHLNEEERSHCSADNEFPWN